MFKKELTAKTLGAAAILNFVLFFFFLTFPYYYLLGADYYVPKASPVWGYFMPNSPQAWLFLIVAFVFLGVAAVAVCLLIWKRPDITLRGYHPL